MNSFRIAFFASGNGSTFQFLAERLQHDETPAEPALLISSSRQALALQRAGALKIPSVTIRDKDFGTEAEFAKALLAELDAKHVDFICLAGYMKLVPREIVRAYSNRMLNVHPALLPAFGGKGMYGIHVHEAVIASGAKLSGATIHLVDEEYDRGPIVAQEAVCVMPDDTPETLAARVHTREVHLYYNTIRLFAQRRVRIHKNHITFLPSPNS
jgi:phosphoribosylglycinamide formyltransferase-1